MTPQLAPTRTGILFVCLGNICRSPLAEGVFLGEVVRRGLGDRFVVDSCGTAAYHVGEAPDPRSCQVAAQYGLDITHQRARQLASADFARFDWIVAMDRANARAIEQARPNGARARVARFMDFVPDSTSQDVPDPYYGGPEGFERVYDLLRRGADRLLDAVLAERAQEAG